MNSVISAKSVLNYACNLIKKAHPPAQQSEVSTLFWIHGGSSYVGSAVANAAGSQAGWRVLSLARKHPSNPPSTNIYEQIRFGSSEDICNAGILHDLMTQHIGEFKGRVIFVNTIGGCHVEKNSSLEKLNKTSVICFAEAINKFIQSSNTIKKPVTLVHCSSIAAEWELGGYGKIKKEADDALLNGIYDHIDHIFSFRIGYVVKSLLEDQKNTNERDSHLFTAEQLAMYTPVQPIILKKDKEFTLYPVHLRDLTEAILNTANEPYESHKKIRKIINAVGSERLTQKEFFNIYINIFKRKLIPLPIDIEEFEMLANNFPCGHIAPYAARYVHVSDPKLNNQSFVDLVKRNLTLMSRVQDEVKGRENKITLDYPFFRYGKQILKNVVTRRASLPALTLLCSLIYRGVKVCIRSKISHFKTISGTPNLTSK